MVAKGLNENVVEFFTETPYFLVVIKKDREVRMLWNSHFGFNREIKMSRNTRGSYSQGKSGKKLGFWA